MEALLENIETEKYLGPEILLQGSGQLPKSGLAGCQGLAPGHVHGLDLLHGHGCSGHIHAATAVLVVLAIPDQLGPHLGKRMGIVRTPADGVRHEDGPLG